MMRRGTLADTSIRSVLTEAASERTTAIIELHREEEGLVYFVDGEIYLADRPDAVRLQDRLVAAGLLTAEQMERHTEPGDTDAYLALALDTDATIDERAVGDWLYELTARTLADFETMTTGEYEVDPYGSHPIGILASWPVDELYERVDQLLAAPGDDEPGAPTGGTDVGATGTVPAGGDPVSGAATDDAGVPGPGPDDDATRAVGPETESPSSPAEGPPADGSSVLITPDTAPTDLASIELTPIEWRIVILAAQRVSQSDLVARLDVDEATAVGHIDELCRRGLLARLN